MSPNALAVRERCRCIFGNPAPPDHVWEKEFDFDDAGLRALAKRDWQHIHEADLNAYYLLNLVYVEPMQQEVFSYLFPICMAEWHEALMNNREFGGFDHWYCALQRPYLFEVMMTPKQGSEVRKFLVESMLERLDQERGFRYEASETPAYVWLRAINELAASVPVLDSLWSRWWSIDTPGKAVSVLMYLSGLIYAKGENPIFWEWTPERGGGGPYLSDTSLEGGWLPENLAVLRRHLTTEQIVAITRRAANKLTGEPEAALAERIATDARERSDIIVIQIDDLLQDLMNRCKA